MATAAELGIHPPATVRIDMGGWVQDWPHEHVELLGDRLRIVLRAVEYPPDGHVALTAVHYAYEHARQLPDGTWLFHGREDFTVTAGPPQPASLN